MYQPPIVNFPVFSVTWSESTDANGVTTPAVLAAGGGGAGKTGVGNKIVRGLGLSGCFGRGRGGNFVERPKCLVRERTTSSAGSDRIHDYGRKHNNHCNIIMNI